MHSIVRIRSAQGTLATMEFFLEMRMYYVHTYCVSSINTGGWNPLLSFFGPFFTLVKPRSDE